MTSNYPSPTAQTTQPDKNPTSTIIPPTRPSRAVPIPWPRDPSSTHLPTRSLPPPVHSNNNSNTQQHPPNAAQSTQHSPAI
ncbi:hypothetical protein BU24DRAFT_417957 [Aaosphaeria arxii CBS 175.79]|uniref:Uncharacterized protein n=1 Tax=Aaosphaeria arxii CBS 175.79 TaxID=1450172 RepID=A0A6A5YAR3_9PLEO|nr:uncharacterized protein BU24DRAFT_417957 [Aaosphaeria arxii CBS 175.79]KAF2022313.1 hypothetical protein BU24DRAFT_417957 [Aaosphaeria arxii CBS 175.79]